MTTDERPTAQLRPLLQPIHQREEKYSQDRIRHSCTELVWPTPVEVKANHASGDREVKNLVDHIERRGHQQASADAFDVKLYSQRRSAETNDRFRDAVDTDGM